MCVTLCYCQASACWLRLTAVFLCSQWQKWVPSGCWRCLEAYTCQSDTDIPHFCYKRCLFLIGLPEVIPCKDPATPSWWTNTYIWTETPNHSQRTENVTICSSKQAGFRGQRDGCPWATENKVRHGVYDPIGVAWKERRNLVCNTSILIHIYFSNGQKGNNHTVDNLKTIWGEPNHTSRGSRISGEYVYVQHVYSCTTSLPVRCVGFGCLALVYSPEGSKTIS